METDPATHTAYIRVPQSKSAVCAHVVEEQMHAICHYMSTLIATLFSGTVLVRPGKN